MIDISCFLVSSRVSLKLLKATKHEGDSLKFRNFWRSCVFSELIRGRVQKNFNWGIAAQLILGVIIQFGHIFTPPLVIVILFDLFVIPPSSVIFCDLFGDPPPPLRRSHNFYTLPNYEKQFYTEKFCKFFLNQKFFLQILFVPKRFQSN